MVRSSQARARVKGSNKNHQENGKCEGLHEGRGGVTRKFNFCSPARRENGNTAVRWRREAQNAHMHTAQASQPEEWNKTP